MAQLKVNLFKRDKDGKYYVKVSLSSAIIHGDGGVRWSHRDVELDSVDSVEAFRRSLMITGGALAEHQNQTYGDIHDADQIANMTAEAWDKLTADKLQGAQVIQ